MKCLQIIFYLLFGIIFWVDNTNNKWKQIYYTRFYNGLNWLKFRYYTKKLRKTNHNLYSIKYVIRIKINVVNIKNTLVRGLKKLLVYTPLVITSINQLWHHRYFQIKQVLIKHFVVDINPMFFIFFYYQIFLLFYLLSSL